LNTGHIHITSDDKIKNFNISTTLDLKTKSGAAPSSTQSLSTHTYLIAGSLRKVAYIMRDHGEEIFKDWYYDNSTETDTQNKKFTLFAPKNNKWGASPDGENIELRDNQKKEIFEKCFKNLHYIISNIFSILDKKGIVDDGIPSSILKIITPSSGSGVSNYIEYKPQPQPSKINIRYIVRDVTMRKSLIDLDDLKKGKIISGRSVVRSRSADPRGRVEVPLHRPSVRVRSVDAPTYRPPVRREGDTRDGRGHFAEPPRGRTGRDGWDGRYPVLATGYRRGGMPMHAKTSSKKRYNPYEDEEIFKGLVDTLVGIRKDTKERLERISTPEVIQRNKEIQKERQAILTASKAREAELAELTRVEAVNSRMEAEMNMKKASAELNKFKLNNPL
jgi:hypothetical protein